MLYIEMFETDDGYWDLSNHPMTREGYRFFFTDLPLSKVQLPTYQVRYILDTDLWGFLINRVGVELTENLKKEIFLRSFM